MDATGCICPPDYVREYCHWHTCPVHIADQQAKALMSMPLNSPAPGLGPVARGYAEVFERTLADARLNELDKQLGKLERQWDAYKRRHRPSGCDIAAQLVLGE